MRMRTATPRDRLFATALANMRYGACTRADMSLVNSLVVGSEPGAPDLTDEKFKNVSIITARNAEKDAFNELGCKRFAEESGQVLTSFYSCDYRAAEEMATGPSGKKGRGRKRPVNAGSGLSEGIQNTLWSSLPCFTEQIPGRLDLCIGMPVMIRSNIATELCMTKGQEGVVCGWTASMGNRKQRVLDVLFVKLLNPPKTVNIEGLEPNVVPLSRQEERVTCLLRNDEVITIDRSQVPVLPNFAMTDYAAQGKTRSTNVVNLTNSRSHQAVYTALSRSSSADGTAIMTSFASGLITKGMDDQLKREFRNLEVLNDITCLRYHNQLPACVEGDTRNKLIKSFLDWKGDHYEIPGLHEALQWKSFEEWDDLDIPFGRQSWQYAENEKTTADKQEQSESSKHGSRTAADEDSGKCSPQEEKRSASNIHSPRGYKWNATDWSCPYDSFFTILHEIWKSNRHRWSALLASSGVFARELDKQWAAYEDGRLREWSATRDIVRSQLNEYAPSDFPYGSTPASVAKLLRAIIGEDTLATKTARCPDCHATRYQGVPALRQNAQLYTTNLLRGRRPASFTTANWLTEVLKGTSRKQTCALCGAYVTVDVNILRTPDILCLDRTQAQLVISPSISYNGAVMNLRGVIYSGQNHFTCRVIDKDGCIYRHDGMINGGECEKEAVVSRVLPTDLGLWRSSNGVVKIASFVVYELDR
ncbi:hypothetical protein EV715DRAFT_214688 [Schizophyllum commune]